MRVEVDFRSHIPIYLQIVEQVRAAIAAGVLRAGAQLPTVRQMAADLRVNFNTVARAYRILDEAAYISTQQGRGTYVLEPPSAERDQGLRMAALEGMLRALFGEAAQMGYGADEVARAAERLIATWRARGAQPTDRKEPGPPERGGPAEGWEDDT